MLETKNFSKSDWMEKIDKALDDVRPHLAVDGGDVVVKDVTSKMEVIIEWQGNCANCDMSEMTLRAGIAQTIKTKFPEIVKVTAA